MEITLNPTLTGGTTVDLTKASQSGGKVTWASPDHSRVEPRLITLGVNGPLSKGNPTARTTLKVDFRDVTTTEGCCDAVASIASFDLLGRFSAGADSALVDSALAYLRALVYSDEFEDALKRGLLA